MVVKEQVKAIVEIKGQIQRTEIFGRKGESTINVNTSLAKHFRQRKEFLPEGAKYTCSPFTCFQAQVMPKLLKDLREFAILMLL